MLATPSTDRPLIELIKVSKVYPPDVVALREISLSVHRGEMVFLTGMSGAGKTTLLKLICNLESPSRGVVEVAGRDLAKIRPAGIQKMRQKIGVAYQDFKLLPRLTVAQNLAMAMEVGYASRQAIHQRQEELLSALRLLAKRDKPVAKLSRGEQQRVALARAAANRPSLLLADEPTGNLDPAMTELVVELFHDLNQQGTTIIVATHDQSLYLDHGHRVLRLDQGVLTEEGAAAPGDTEMPEAATASEET